MARGLIEFDIAGADKVRANLARLSTKLSDVAGRALREEAEIEMTEAKERTPVDTGALRASGRVLGPTVGGEDIEVQLVFGNASVDYALHVHENPDALHPVGQWKYLESTLVESASDLPDRIGRRIDAALKGQI
jgi:hypothetical protein